MNLSELDALMATSDLAVRPETLTEAWDATAVHDRTALPTPQVLVLVVMHARPGAEARLAEASRRFARATSRLTGALGSTVHQSSEDPQTFFLLERFSGEESFGAHMASDYFGRFQVEQATLLAEPVQAHFLQR